MRADGDDPAQVYHRRSARVVVVDAAGRVLLLKLLMRAVDGGPFFWATPGGGVRDDETLPQAATRELLEEVGLDAGTAGIGPHIAYTSGYAKLSWAEGIFRDDFFLHRVTSHEVDHAGMEDFELGHHGGHRWWTVDELTTTTDPVYPLGLAGLVGDVLTGRVPAAPVRLPWHH